jgi:flagellar export protein FliJ
MKKFRFQFETLEKVRRTREGEALRFLGEAQAKLAEAVARKQELEASRELGLIRREQLGKTATSPTAFLLETDFITGQKYRIIQSDVSIQRAKRGVEKALRNYLQAKRQTRVIEMLREKQFTEYKVQRSKYEQKQMDDLTTMRNRLKDLDKESA